VVIRYPKDLVPVESVERSACGERFELGKSVVVKEGEDSSVAIAAYGSVLIEALEAADMLEGEGISVDVINARFAAPIDKEIINLLEEGKGLITVEDHRVSCGFGSAVLEAAAAAGPGMQKSVVVLGMPSRYIKHDRRGVQFVEGGISADKIAEATRAMVVAQGAEVPRR
jgi:1-deoxy-D-xylulose-5-phosphate synthase